MCFHVRACTHTSVHGGVCECKDEIAAEAGEAHKGWIMKGTALMDSWGQNVFSSLSLHSTNM